MKKLEEISKKTVNRLIDTVRYGWPPDCAGYIYQPERPVQRKEACDAEKTSEKE